MFLVVDLYIHCVALDFSGRGLQAGYCPPPAAVRSRVSVAGMVGHGLPEHYGGGAAGRWEYARRRAPLPQPQLSGAKSLRKQDRVLLKP